MIFSASQLVKSSARQIAYLRNKPVKKPSEAMRKGNEDANAKCSSPYQEMGGSYEYKDIKILFSIDEVKLRAKWIETYEHKSVKRTAEEWYLHSSLIQTAFYNALVEQCEGLVTSVFHPGERHNLTLDKPIRARLTFGHDVYSVKQDTAEILKFYFTKARATLIYPRARDFDKKYHHKEWDYLKHYIEFKPLAKLKYNEVKYTDNN